VELPGPAPWPAASRPDRGVGVQQRHHHLRVMNVRGGDQDREWEPGAVAEDVNLRARFAAVDRVWPCRIPLFSARTEIESATALDQSISETTFNRVRNAACSRSHSPTFVHSLKRRCTVARLVPNIAAGSFRHEQPAWTMYTIAARTARSLIRGVPPPCGRGGGTGINGCATCQKSSGAHVRIMSSITNRPSCRR
jgi:hypothetical protein